MKTMKLALALCCAVSLSMAACDKDDYSPLFDTYIDMGVDTTADTMGDTAVDPTLDTTPDPVVDSVADTTMDTVTDTGTDSTTGCTTTGFTAVAQEALDYSPNGLVYNGYTATAEPVDIVAIEFFNGSGSPPPLTGPGSYTLATTAAEQNYATCGTCVLVRAGCSTSACTNFYFATGGTLNVTTWGAVGGQFTGTLTDVTLVEVTISDDGTYTSTPVPGGMTWCLPSYSFDATIATGT